jgi:hypothetical protein
MQNLNHNKRMIAIDVRARSFGFVVFDGPRRLLSWGVKSFRRGVNAVKMPASRKLAALFDDFSPGAIVLRNCNLRHERKRTEMLSAILAAARKRGIPVHRMSKRTMVDAFTGNGQNKHSVALVVARSFPELASNLPRKRKIWEGEDYRMTIFDAAAAAVAYWEGEKAQTSTPP